MRVLIVRPLLKTPDFNHLGHLAGVMTCLLLVLNWAVRCRCVPRYWNNCMFVKNEFCCLWEHFDGWNSVPCRTLEGGSAWDVIQRRGVYWDLYSTCAVFRILECGTELWTGYGGWYREDKESAHNFSEETSWKTDTCNISEGIRR